MSYTLYPLRKQRLQRSYLAVPGSNPTMIERALKSAADYVFLDCEDAVAPPDKEQARKNIIQALNDLDWKGAGKTVSVRINGLDTHYMYRDVVDIMEQAGSKLDTILIPKVGVPADVYTVECIVSQIEVAKGLHEQGRHRSADRDAARHGQRRSHRRRADSRLEVDALRRRRLRGLQQGAHRRHRRPQPRLSGRPVALPAVAHDGRLPRLRPASDRRSVRRLRRSGRLHGRLPAAAPLSASKASGPSIPRRSSSPTRCSRRPAKEVERAERILVALKEAEAQGKGAASLDGKMIDAASEKMANNLLATAAAIKAAEAARKAA